MKTFFQDGIPPLGERLGSKSRGSVSKEKHDDALLLERSDYGLFPDESLCRLDSSVLWQIHEENGSLDWGSESDIQGMVKQVLQSAIYTVGLKGKLKCFNELSIFDLRPDIWIVYGGGIPIGVVEVKKPGEDGTLQNSYMHGQLFDYMLQLQSFYGVEQVFGILTSYGKWRVCWMPRSDGAAMATSATAQIAQEREVETQTVVPERVLHGSKLYAWNDKNLSRVVCTTILKMFNAPRSPVHLIDPNRPYIILDKDQCLWGKISVEDESKLYHSVLPTANKFTLLADLPEGADGRLWRACTDAGLGCCIKFPIRSTSSSDESAKVKQLAQIQNEANWQRVYGPNSARVTTLSGRPALIMRYLRPLELQDGELLQEDLAAVKTAIENFASKGLKHDDLALRHLGILSPPKKSRSRTAGSKPEPEVMLCDLGRVSEADPEVGLADMMGQLNLS